MSSATTTQARPPLNGVDVATLFATIDAVKAQPEAAKFQFRAVNRWVSGTHSRTTIDGSSVSAPSSTTKPSTRPTPTTRRS